MPTAAGVNIVRQIKMSWLLIIGIPAIAVLLFVFKKRVDATPDPSREEISKTIADFLEGRGGPYDWDHFISIPLKNPELEKIRKECFDIRIAYPGKKKTEWCSDEGVTELRCIYVRLIQTANT